MKDINTTTFTCRLTQDPELRQTPSGKSVCTLRVAINHGSDRGAAFYSVETWGVLAENCARYLTKGRRIAVQGRLDHGEWRTEQEQRRDRNYVTAEQVQFLDAPPTSEPAEQPEHEPAAA